MNTHEHLLAVLRTVNKDIPDDPDLDLLAAHLLDSFDMVHLVAGIEEAFDIELDPEDIVPEHFRTAAAMQALVERYLVSYCYFPKNQVE